MTINPDAMVAGTQYCGDTSFSSISERAVITIISPELEFVINTFYHFHAHDSSNQLNAFLPLSHWVWTNALRSRRYAHTIHMITSKYQRKYHGNDKTKCCPITKWYVPAAEICYRRNAIQYASAILFNTGIQNIFPMMPCHRWCYTAYKSEYDDQWIKIC